MEQLTGSEEKRAQLQYARGWLSEDKRYITVEQKTARGIPTSRMTDAWIDQLRDHGVIAEIGRDEVRGHVNMFAVMEEAKQRWRAIKYTRDVNDALGRESVMHLRFPSKQDICGLVHKGECFIALDFAAYYDQFVYTPEVGARFCFRHGDRYYLSLIHI